MSDEKKVKNKDLTDASRHLSRDDTKYVKVATRYFRLPLPGDLHEKTD